MLYSILRIALSLNGITGTGYAMVVVSWVLSLYYNVIVAQTLLYLFYSFTSELPWISCNNTWNGANCIDIKSTLTDALSKSISL